MSVVTIQLGQCGNQIGCDLFSLLYQDAHQPPQYTSSGTSDNVTYRMDMLERYFTECEGRGTRRYEAKAVMVDMEEKVVHACKQAAMKSGNSFVCLFSLYKRNFNYKKKITKIKRLLTS